ncbi:MAG: hypothetical protein WDM80_08325 [Limisphaerales bacterium]
MPATIITSEKFDASIPRKRIDSEIQLRIKAGAIRSWVEESEPKWTLKTEWNVFGQND